MGIPSVNTHPHLEATMPATHLLRIEHPIPDFRAWKAAFDSDPLDRQRAGVRRYRVLRPVDDPHYAMVDLEFDTRDEAEATLHALRELWGQVEGTVIGKGNARIVEITETVDL